MTRPVTGYASTWLEASSLVGGKQSLEKATGQDLSVLGSCEKLRDHLRQDSLIEHRGSFSMGQKALLHKAQKALFLKGARAKAHGKGKQILGKGNLKKVACAKGKVSDDQILAQMLKFRAKRLRANEASKEENNRAPKRLYELVNLGLAGAVFRTV
nr:hypothetical protein CFP56_31125 [Quercus suber]